jgi:hypothetical protein
MKIFKMVDLEEWFRIHFDRVMASSPSYMDVDPVEGVERMFEVQDDKQKENLTYAVWNQLSRFFDYEDRIASYEIHDVEYMSFLLEVIERLRLKTIRPELCNFIMGKDSGASSKNLWCIGVSNADNIPLRTLAIRALFAGDKMDIDTAIGYMEEFPTLSYSWIRDQSFELAEKYLPMIFDICDRQNKMHEFYTHLKILADKYGFGIVEQAVRDINLPRT